MINAYLKRLETARNGLNWAERELERAREKLEIATRAGDQLAAACAAISYAASSDKPQDLHSLQRLGFTPLSGAALHTALSDALARGWVGRTDSGQLHWRDEGLSKDCPLVTIARTFKRGGK